MVHAKQKQNEKKKKTKQNAKQTKILYAKRIPKFSRGNRCKHLLDLKVRVVHFGLQVI